MFVAILEPHQHHCGGKPWLIGTLSPSEQHVHSKVLNSSLAEMPPVTPLKVAGAHVGTLIVLDIAMLFALTEVPITAHQGTFMIPFMIIASVLMLWTSVKTTYEWRLSSRYNKLCMSLMKSDRFVDRREDERWQALKRNRWFNRRLAEEYKDVVDDYLCDPEVVRINQLFQHTRPKPSKEQQLGLKKALRVKADAAVEQIHALDAPQRMRRRLQREEAKRLAALETQADQTVFDQEVAEVIRHVNEQ